MGLKLEDWYGSICMMCDKVLCQIFIVEHAVEQLPTFCVQSMFFFLVQTEQGDIFKVTLETDEDIVSLTFDLLQITVVTLEYLIYFVIKLCDFLGLKYFDTVVFQVTEIGLKYFDTCLLYTSPSPRD